MSATRSSSAGTTRRAVALVLATLVAVLLPVSAASAGPPPPRPADGVATSITFTTVSTPSVPLPSGAPGAVGLWYAVQDVPFQADLSFRDVTGNPAPLSTNKTVTVSVRHGGTLLGTSDVPPNETSATVALAAIADPAANVTLTASGDIKPKAVTGTSRQFDVLTESKSLTSGRNSIGGQGGTETECVATPGEPVCADLLPPTGGAFVDGGLFSRGVCLATDPTCLVSYIQALASLTGGDASHPATLIMKCDKTLCGGGAIKSKHITVTLAPGSGDLTAPACPAKGTVGAYDATKPLSATNAPFCVDYVQSTRDNAGDTILYLLFYVDLKARFG